MKKEPLSADERSIKPIMNESASSGAANSLPALKLDADEYREFIEKYDLSEDQSQEYLEILWQIVVTFVDIGFGIEPVQKAMEAGQNRNSITIPAHEIDTIMDRSKDTETNKRETTS